MEELLKQDPTYPDKTKLLATMKSLAEQSGFTDRAEAIADRISTIGSEYKE
jgi:hypothetical protein